MGIATKLGSYAQASTSVLPAPPHSAPQLLLLFLGKIETERPSDGVLRFFGQLGGLPVDAVDYEAPAGVRAATVATFAATGFVVAAASAALLGDASWSVSAGTSDGLPVPWPQQLLK